MNTRNATFVFFCALLFAEGTPGNVPEEGGDTRAKPSRGRSWRVPENALENAPENVRMQGQHGCAERAILKSRKKKEVAFRYFGT